MIIYIYICKLLPYNFFERVIYEIDLKNTFPDDFSPLIVLYEPELSGSFYFTMLHHWNQSLTWKQVKTEGKYFDFSNINYKEIHIIAYYNNYRVSCSFTQDDNGNYYFGSNEPGWVGAVIIKDNTNKGISLQNFLLSGSDVTIDANIAVYYR